MTEISTTNKVRSRSHGDTTESVLDSSVTSAHYHNGKEVVIRNSYRGGRERLSGFGAAATASLGRRSLRRKSKEPKPSYYRLNAVEYNNYGGNKTNSDDSANNSPAKTNKPVVTPATNTNTTSSGGGGSATRNSGRAPPPKKNNVMSFSDVFSTLKMGISTFSLPKIQNKNKMASQHHSTNGSHDATGTATDATNTTKTNNTSETRGRSLSNNIDNHRVTTDESIPSTKPLHQRSRSKTRDDQDDVRRAAAAAATAAAEQQKRNDKRKKSEEHRSKKGSKGGGLLMSASSTDIRSAGPPRGMNGGSGGGIASMDSVRQVTSDIIATGGHASSSSAASSPASRCRTPPGITGLRNHGNTCYMNAVVQCLVHTDNLAKYLVMDQYKVDLARRRNKTNARKFGTRGEVTEQLALLFKALWSSRYTPDISSQFRTVVGKYESQYRESNQQDAQEFLLWLMDKVHEDLNTGTKKTYKTIKNKFGRPDEIVAAEAQRNHVKCNNSFVHDLFQAQYRSSLTCPICQQQSTTFDPFLCISTPIPQRQYRPIFVTVVYLDQQPKQVKLGLSINTQANILELRELISTNAGIPTTQLIITELHQDNFGRTFKDSESVNSIQESDAIYGIEVPPQNQSDTRQGEKIILLWANKVGVGTAAKRFGGPYAMEVSRETNYVELQKLVLQSMVNVLRDGMLEKEVDSFLRFRVVDGIPGKCYLPDDVEHPLYMQTVDQALMGMQHHDRGPVHLKVSVEWDSELRDIYMKTTDESVEDHHTVSEMRNQHNKQITATLSDCFNLYTQEEKLGPDDSWLCPSCKRPQEGVKKLSLWSVPDVLVIHLKRFRQTNTQRTKLETRIDFPIYDLDMSPHIVHRSELGNIHSNGNGNGILGYWSPWRNSSRHSQRPDNNVYDLYAICNHHGSMQSGHYTAYCKNPTDSLWYHFDDTNVKKVDESHIVTSSAYILFYQRRSLGHGSSSSETGSTYSCPDHWVYHMPSFHYASTKVSKSHDNLCDLDDRSKSSTLPKERSFFRGTRKYSSLIHTSTSKRAAHKYEEEPFITIESDSNNDRNSPGYLMSESSV